MAEYSSFFNSVAGDRKYSAEDWAEYFAALITNGVFPDPSTNLQVTSNSNMTVAVAAGKAWINGYYYSNTASMNKTIEAAHGSLPRIDRIAVKYDINAREITVVVKKGTAASSPVAVALQRDVNAYEIGIADILVGAAVTSIITANITDLRVDPTYCGWVNSLIAVDASTLFAQLQAGYEEWFAGVEAILDANTAGNLLNLINAIPIVNGGGAEPTTTKAGDFWLAEV